jgi:hypothetical protein
MKSQQTISSEHEVGRNIEKAEQRVPACLWLSGILANHSYSRKPTRRRCFFFLFKFENIRGNHATGDKGPCNDQAFWESIFLLRTCCSFPPTLAFGGSYVRYLVVCDCKKSLLTLCRLGGFFDCISIYHLFVMPVVLINIVLPSQATEH